MKDVAEAVIFSYQFPEAVIWNISLKIIQQKKKKTFLLSTHMHTHTHS